MRTATWVWMVAMAWPAGPGLAGDLQSPDAAIRRHAARRLGLRGDKAAAGSLVAALGDADPGVRREAARALATLRDARTAKALGKALADSDTTVRFCAAHALGEIKSPASAEALARALGDPQWCVRDQAAWALRELPGAGVAERLLPALRAGDADVAQVAWILAGQRDHALPKVARLLADADAPVRRRAADVLGAFGDAAALDALVAALGDPDARVRLAAVGALGRIGTARAAKALAAAARQEQDPAVRAEASRTAERLSRDERLLAHWSFDDPRAAGRDVTGRGNDGKVRGCTSEPGKVGRALRFDKGRFIELGKPKAMRIGGVPLTILAWARPAKPTGVVVARGGAFCGFSLYVKDGTARFGIHRDPNGPGAIAAGKDQVVGTWVHLAGVVRKDRIELYVNGRRAASAKTAGFIPGECGQGMEIGFDAGNSPAEITDGFVGLLDEVKVYAAALSAEEIARHAAAGK